MMTLYHALSCLAGLALAPLFAAWSGLTGRKRRGLGHYFGFLPPVPRPRPKTLWLHALSVGEVHAAAPILQAIRAKRPDLRQVVTVTTDAGYAAARSKLTGVEVIGFHPLDCWPFLRLALRRVRPDLFALMDTGFWPGLFDLLRARGVPMVLLNGRVSKRSLERYRRFPWLTRPLMRGFSKIFMQSEEGVQAMVALGADPAATRSLGNVKYDLAAPGSPASRDRSLAALGLEPGTRLLLAGSTHAGEEAILLEAWQRLREKFPDLVLMLAPRRLERLGEIEALLREQGVAYRQRSAEDGPRAPVILLDTMGELAGFYPAAAAAFVGRSLIAPGGGHSLIEPAAAGVPVLHGPFIENSGQQAQDLAPTGALFAVKDAGDIAAVVARLLTDPAAVSALGQRARAVIQAKQGAAGHLAEEVLGLLDPGPVK